MLEEELLLEDELLLEEEELLLEDELLPLSSSEPEEPPPSQPAIASAARKTHGRGLDKVIMLNPVIDLIVESEPYQPGISL